MYYLELLDKFWEFNKKSKLGASVAAVYVYLLKTGYENGRYDFKVSDLIQGFESDKKNSKIN
jgi:hypothetical protein